MMNRLNINKLWPAIALGLLASCSADVEQEAQQGGAAIRLTAEEQTVAAPTRAASTADLQNTAFAAGEDVAVFVVDRANASTYASTPYRFRASAVDGAGHNALTYYSDATTASVLCYPITPSASVDIYGFYPYSLFASVSDRTTDDLAFSVSADQSTAAAYRASDVMMATAITDQARTESTVNLQFRHLMAKLVVRLKQGVHTFTASELTGSTVTIGSVTTDATLDMTDGTVTTGSNSTTVTLASDADLAFYYSNSDAVLSTTEYAIVLPAQALTGKTIGITTGVGETITGTLPELTLTAGISTVLTLTIDNGVIVSSTVVQDYIWNNEEEGIKQVQNYDWNDLSNLPDNAIEGKFTINDSGDQVCFSKGNLQATYNGSSWTWAFAANQWNYIGNASGNRSVNGNGTVSASNVTVDLFGWVGESSAFTGAAMYGISNSTTNNLYGNVSNEALKSDWGNTVGDGWRTPTSDELAYLFGSRSTASGVLCAKAIVNNVRGLILLPDNWRTSYHSLTSANTADADYTTNVLSSSEWLSDFEAYGAVFLPAAGNRYKNGVSGAGGAGYYWSSSPDGTNAYRLFFTGSCLYPCDPGAYRRGGNSVRLVHDL